MHAAAMPRFAKWIAIATTGAGKTFRSLHSLVRDLQLLALSPCWSEVNWNRFWFLMRVASPVSCWAPWSSKSSEPQSIAVVKGFARRGSSASTRASVIGFSATTTAVRVWSPRMRFEGLDLVALDAERLQGGERRERAEVGDLVSPHADVAEAGNRRERAEVAQRPVVVVQELRDGRSPRGR